nr:protein rep [Providencia stuartii]
MLYENDKASCVKVNSALSARKLKHDAKNGKTLNDRKTESLKLAKIYYALSDKEENENIATRFKKRAGRVVGCCDTREMCVDPDHYGFTIHTHRCRDRMCLECRRVKCFVEQERIRAIMPALCERTDEKDGFIFGTLTIKNPPIDQLKITLKIMSRSFKRLLTRKKLKAVARGGFRCFETTRGNIKDHCHPHIHFLLQVDKKYFNNKGPFYMKEAEWAEEWTKCLQAECEKENIAFNRADYPNEKAFVKILRVQTPHSMREQKKVDENGKKPKRIYSTVRDLRDGSDNVVNYVLKYTSKSDDLVKNDAWFKTYIREIAGIRSISYFGIYKELIAELPVFEYSEEKIKEKIYEDMNPDLNQKPEDFKFYTATWCDDHQYVLSDQTLEEALNKKRLNIVNSIKGTLKVQIENQNISLDLIVKSMKNKDYMVTNDAIIELNKIKARTRATFARLEKTGEVKNLKDVYDYEFNAELINDFDLLFSESEIEQIIKQNQKAFEILDATIDCPF